MKYTIYLIFFFSLHSHAQKGRHDVLNPEELKVKEFKLEAERIAPSEIRLPFSKIRIIDSRFDTSKIGYIPSRDFFAGKRKLYKKMVFSSGIANAIEKYYNDYYSASFTENDFELVIVMKKFWISGNPGVNNKRAEVNNSVKGGTGFYCKWEYYLSQKDKYLPVKRIDTVLILNNDIAKYIEEEFSENTMPNIKFALKYLIEILDYSNAISQFGNQSKKTWADITTYNDKMFNLPALQTNGFTKGVYLNFEEFKNNTPSISNFEEKKMKYRLINSENYLEDEQGNTISNYWGYCNGSEFRYGMFGNEKVYRINNTFCFFIKVTGYIITPGNNLSTGPSSGIATTTKNKYEVWVPYQLDMETGEIY